MAPRFDKLLVLDLDETLVYGTNNPSEVARKADFSVGPYQVFKRPHLDSFLKACQSWFTVGVWTSSGAAYAEGVVSRLFANPHELAFLWSRNRCTPKKRFDLHGETTWIKDLKKLKSAGFALSTVLVVDDSPEKHERNYGNLVRVRAYVGQDGDEELPVLAAYLEQLGDVENVRKIDKRNWRDRFGKSPA